MMQNICLNGMMGKISGLRPFLTTHTFCYEEYRATPLNAPAHQNYFNPKFPIWFVI